MKYLSQVDLEKQCREVKKMMMITWKIMKIKSVEVKKGSANIAKGNWKKPWRDMRTLGHRI